MHAEALRLMCEKRSGKIDGEKTVCDNGVLARGPDEDEHLALKTLQDEAHAAFGDAGDAVVWSSFGGSGLR